ncbi:uncharacterized protein LOC119692673 [Plutella xylostella]|uniref:uncharacterized protein LOC119692673 n=1 Tax=Plutella xylostella TaxID=51655 RepID=UPI002032439A|nr:uncharacterized protein LOC119692673 [Plutella xylostella]
MYSKFPFPVSMENLPRPRRSFGCFSLKLGCVLTALILILYSIFVLAHCGRALSALPGASPDAPAPLLRLGSVVYTAVHSLVTLFLSTLMMIGALRETPSLMRPWLVWVSVQVVAILLLFITYVASGALPVSRDLLGYYLLQGTVFMIRVYMLVLVGSYYRQLEEEQDQTERLRSLLDKDFAMTHYC